MSNMSADTFQMGPATLRYFAVRAQTQLCRVKAADG